MEIEFQSMSEDRPYKYTLAESLTGRDFLDLRGQAMADGKLNMDRYGHVNIIKRLKAWTRPEPITDESVLNLPQDVYQVLFNLGFRLDNEELKGANHFLLKYLNLSQPSESPSPSENFSSDLQPGPGPSSRRALKS